MAKTLRTSEDYTVKAGSGAAGTHTIKLDSKLVRVTGDLTIDGTQVVQNVTNTSIEDQFMELNRNASSQEDAGIVFNGGGDPNAIFFFDASADDFALATTTTDFADGSTTKFEVSAGNLTYRNLHINETPSSSTHAASKSYVDTQVGGGFSLKVAGDDSTQITVATGNTLQFSGTNGITTTGSEPDTITIGLSNNLEDIHSITNSSTNADITISANSNGSVVIDDVLTFPANRSGEPSATEITKMFAQTPSGGGTGLFFVNTSVSSGAAGELISKKKATALAIALG